MIASYFSHPLLTTPLHPRIFNFYAHSMLMQARMHHHQKPFFLVPHFHYGLRELGSPIYSLVHHAYIRTDHWSVHAYAPLHIDVCCHCMFDFLSPIFQSVILRFYHLISSHRIAYTLAHRPPIFSGLTLSRPAFVFEEPESSPGPGSYEPSLPVTSSHMSAMYMRSTLLCSS